MNILQRTSAISAVLLGLASSAFSQSRILVEVEEPQFEELKSPDFAGAAKKKWDQKEWLEMEVEFQITKVDPATAKFVNNLTVKWYVAAENPEGKGYILLEEEVEHINIPVGEAIYSSVYLAPSAILRLTGGDRAGKNAISRVGGEILFNGQKVAEFSSKDKPGWWQSSSLARFDKFPLRGKHETPFHYFWWDRYAENKVERR